MSHSKRGIISIYENGANKNMALQWQKKYLSTAWNTFISSTVQVNSFVNFKNDSYRLPYLLRVMNKDQRNWRHIYYLDNAIFQLFKIKFKVFQITCDRPLMNFPAKTLYSATTGTLEFLETNFEMRWFFHVRYQKYTAYAFSISIKLRGRA